METSNKPLRIWVVDDDKIYRFTVRCMLEQWDPKCMIEEFTDATSALSNLRLLKTDPDILPDILLVDVFMPEVDGWDFITDLAAVIKHLPKKIKFLIVTASLDEEVRMHLRDDMAIQGMLLKPVVLQDFEALVPRRAA